MAETNVTPVVVKPVVMAKPVVVAKKSAKLADLEAALKK